jgi:excisionase family DNA binding protein
VRADRPEIPSVDVRDAATVALPVTLPPQALEQLARALAPIVAALLADQRTAGWLDVPAAAAYLACPKGRVYELANRGLLPCERDGRRLLFRAEELDRWVRAGGARRAA